MRKDETREAANNIRVLSAAMVERAQSGHPGGAMGGAEFINILYTEYLQFDPDDTLWIGRDRFFLDPGHMSAMLYATLALCGFYSMDELKQFRQWGSPTPGHPERDVQRGVENTSGPLGQGHTFAVGAAVAALFLKERVGEWLDPTLFAYISDGGVQEEISQGAGRIAGHLGLGNLVLFYDANGVQLSTKTETTTSEKTAEKYRAWGWEVVTIDATDPAQIRTALDRTKTTRTRPFLIIGKTIMGQGVLDKEGASFEGKVSLHGQPLGRAGACFEKTVTALGGDSEDPFRIFPNVARLYERAKEKKRGQVKEKRRRQEEWERSHPALKKKRELFFSGRIPEIDFGAIPRKTKIATRIASSHVLESLAETVENMIVLSADLCNSDKTDGFLEKTRPLAKGDWGGAFLQAGVSELTMAALASGMALHGGVIPACGTFLVFSDYMKPVVRTAALMGLPVKYIWTHDSFRVGEDGPTHQPVEHETQIRLLERMRNHAGKRSLLVLRPADTEETLVAWRMAMDNQETPTALLLSRQNIGEMAWGKDPLSIERQSGVKRGGYIIRSATGIAEIVLVANGSEVATALGGGFLLEKKEGKKVQVVSIPSEGLFRDQERAYQERVLPRGVPRMGITAGLSQAMEALVGEEGDILSVDTFGYSAPASVLDQRFGFSAENVYRRASALLKRHGQQSH